MSCILETFDETKHGAWPYVMSREPNGRRAVFIEPDGRRTFHFAASSVDDGPLSDEFIELHRVGLLFGAPVRTDAHRAAMAAAPPVRVIASPKKPLALYAVIVAQAIAFAWVVLR